MIERLFKNELSRKRWRIFKKRKLAMAASLGLLVMTLLTFLAPILANNKPIYINYKGNSYWPIFAEYRATEFGVTDSMVVNFRKLKMSEDDMAVWPLVDWDPFESNRIVEVYPSPPSENNWFGTDDRGRDVFTRILYGFKYSIIYAVVVWVFSTIIGIIVGGVMGYFGGRVDFFGLRFVEIFSTVPSFFLLLILISLFTPSLTLLVIISSIFGWVGISYYVRGEFLKNRNREFVEAARATGVPTWKILFKHILPNSLIPVITFAPFTIAGHIAGLASLDFLGFGLEIPTPSWGELLAQAHKNFTIAWWLAVFPSGALFLTLVMMNLVGEGVRDAFDPRKT
ncbi:MAG: ABC transporter permease subunit [Bacteriovoracaceae bacterium]